MASPDTVWRSRCPRGTMIGGEWVSLGRHYSEVLSPWQVRKVIKENLLRNVEVLNMFNLDGDIRNCHVTVVPFPSLQ